jgi:hypothetical protein
VFASQPDTLQTKQNIKLQQQKEQHQKKDNDKKVTPKNK